MLQLIRENAQGFVIWAIVGLIILGLSSFILSSYLGGGIKTYVAKVNDTEISDRQFRLAFNNRQAQLQQRLGENFSRFFDASLLRNSVVMGLVNEELVNQLSFDAGFRVGPDQVQKELAKIVSLQDDKGLFSNEKLRKAVEQVGYTVKAYALDTAQRLSNDQLLTGISKSAIALTSTANEFQKLNRQQRDVSVLRIKKSVIANSLVLSDEDVKVYFELHANEYMTDEQVKVDYLELSLKALADAQIIDSDEINQFYEKNKARYTMVDDTAALAKISIIKSKLTPKKTFAELAKEFSEDKFSVKTDGKIGRMTRGQTSNKALSDSLFTLASVGDVSQPVRSEFGFHLIRLDKILSDDEREASHILIKHSEKTKVKPLAAVKVIIERELKGQKAERIFYEGKTKLENLTYQYQDSLEPAAEEIDLKIKTSSFFTRRGGSQIFRNQELLGEIFGEEVLLESLNSQMIKLSDDHVIVVRLNQHKPAKPMSLEQVKGLVENKLKQEKATAQVAQLSQQKLLKLNAGSGVNDLVEVEKITWTEFGFIGRTNRYDQVMIDKAMDKTKTDPVTPDVMKVDKAPMLVTPVSTEVRKASFMLQKPTADKPIYHSMTARNGDGLIVVLRAIRDNPGSEDASVTEAIQKQLSQTVGLADSLAIIEFMRSKSDVDVNRTKDETL